MQCTLHFYVPPILIRIMPFDCSTFHSSLLPYRVASVATTQQLYSSSSLMAKKMSSLFNFHISIDNFHYENYFCVINLVTRIQIQHLMRSDWSMVDILGLCTKSLTFNNHFNDEHRTPSKDTLYWLPKFTVQACGKPTPPPKKRIVELDLFVWLDSIYCHSKRILPRMKM